MSAQNAARKWRGIRGMQFIIILALTTIFNGVNGGSVSISLAIHMLLLWVYWKRGNKKDA